MVDELFGGSRNDEDHLNLHPTSFQLYHSVHPEPSFNPNLSNPYLDPSLPSSRHHSPHLPEPFHHSPPPPPHHFHHRYNNNTSSSSSSSYEQPQIIYGGGGRHYPLLVLRSQSGNGGGGEESSMSRCTNDYVEGIRERYR